MQFFMQSALIYFCYLAVPVISLIILYKIKKSLWFALPVSAIAVVIALWPVLTSNYGGLVWLMIFYQLIILSILITAFKLIAKFRQKRLEKLPDETKKSYLSKEKKIMITGCVTACVITAGIITHNILMQTSDGYNQIFDKQVFNELTKISADDIASVELIYARIKLEDENFDGSYRGDKSFFSDLEFDGSRLKNPGVLHGEEMCSVRFITKNGDHILFMTGGGDRFLAHYKNKIFYVKSPELWEEIKK